MTVYNAPKFFIHYGEGGYSYYIPFITNNSTLIKCQRCAASYQVVLNPHDLSHSVDQFRRFGTHRFHFLCSIHLFWSL